MDQKSGATDPWPQFCQISTDSLVNLQLNETDIKNPTAKSLLLSLWVKKKLKSANIWQRYKQERDCLCTFFVFWQWVGQTRKWKTSQNRLRFDRELWSWVCGPAFLAHPVQLGGVPCDRFRRSGRWWWRAGGRCRSVARDRTAAASAPDRRRRELRPGSTTKHRETGTARTPLHENRQHDSRHLYGNGGAPYPH